MNICDYGIKDLLKNTSSVFRILPCFFVLMKKSKKLFPGKTRVRLHASPAASENPLDNFCDIENVASRICRTRRT